MRERADAVEFFTPLVKNSNMQQSVFLADKYAYVRKKGEFCGCVPIRDTISLTNPVQYNFDKDIVEDNTEVPLRSVLQMFGVPKTECSFDIRSLITNVEAAYDSFAKRQKILTEVFTENNKLICKCGPIKKRSLLEEALFEVGKSSHNIHVSVNLNSLYLVCKYVFDGKNSRCFIANEGIILSEDIDLIRFFVSRKTQEDYQKSS